MKLIDDLQQNNGTYFDFKTTVRKDCSRDRENLLKFEAEVQEFAKFLIPLEQFI